MAIKFLSGGVSLLILLMIIDLVRRDKLTFKYAFGWMAVSSFGLFFAIFDRVLFGLSRFFGFELPSNFVFFMLLVFFVFLSLFLTIYLCQQNNRNDTMAQKIGILEFELKQLTQKLESIKKDDHAA